MKTVISLDPQASQRAIEAATRTQAQIILESSEFPEATVNGFLISGDDKALLMEVTGRPASGLENSGNVRCVACLYAEQRYHFSTTILGIQRRGQSTLLAIGRPRAIGVIERRRFLRAKPAPSSQIRLAWSQSGADHTYRAPLLNISPDGVACRVEDTVAVLIEKHDPVGTSFDLPGRHQPFHLAATVMNKTPASEGYTILGLQFAQSADAAEQLAALRELLAHPVELKPTVEACV